MRDLIDNISGATGLAPAKAEQALGIMFNLLRNQGDRTKVAALFAKLPGAAELAEGAGGDGAAKGGLLGLLVLLRSDFIGRQLGRFLCRVWSNSFCGRRYFNARC